MTNQSPKRTIDAAGPIESRLNRIPLFVRTGQGSRTREVRCLLFCLILIGIVAPAMAQQQSNAPAAAPFAPTPLTSAFRAAKNYDPQYRSALAEKTVNDAAVTTSRYAYLPEARYSISQSELETASRKTLQITQPVVSVDRFLQYREAGPRATLSESTLTQREQDLAQRLLRAVTELVRAREAARVNEYRISLLEEQAKRAKRMFELNEGTTTDMRDAAVQLDQAKANQFALLTRVKVAENQYSSIVGSEPAKNAYQIAAVPRRFSLEAVDRYLDGGRSINPALVTARQNELIAESTAKRAKASLLPQVAATYISTESAGHSFNYTGASLIYPLQGQSIAQISSAGAQVERAREQVRQTEQQIKVDIERLRALVESGQQEWAVRKDAIGSAELAVQANLKSQQGGIRTSVEVLNAIQTLANVRNDYASTAAALAENYLTLLLQAAFDPTEAMQKVQAAVFDR